ncbi:MAG: MFS transporter [Bryobacteraceae bacterium]
MSTKPADILPNLATHPGSRDWPSGFFLVGTLIALPASLSIAWHYHIGTPPELIGLHFLALNIGYVIAAATAQRLLARVSIRSIALFACTICFLSLLALSFLAPPVVPLCRIVGLGFVGVSAGALVTALLYGLEPYYQRAPGAAASICGVFFRCGCLLTSLVGGTSYFTGCVHIETALLAIVPLVYFVVYATNRDPPALASVKERLRHGLEDLRSIAAVLFSFVLFFQFSNEWAIAGWLPLYLIHRLGMNPAWAILVLAVYFFALLLGRLAAQRMVPFVNHRRLLLVSITFSILGYLLLTVAGSLVGAALAVVVIGIGFGSVYPLIVESLDERFAYHPGFYNGIFSIAITGAMTAPWLGGYVESYFGMRYVMLIPALGSIAVFILTLLIMLEARLTGGAAARLRHAP